MLRYFILKSTPLHLFIARVFKQSNCTRVWWRMLQTFTWLNVKLPNIFWRGRGVRERKSRRLVLASITGGCVEGFKAAQKRQALQNSGLRFILPGYQDSQRNYFYLVLKIPTGKPKSPILCRANSLLLKWVQTSF